MKKTLEAKNKKIVPAEQIAKLADQGKDVSHFFTNKGKMVHPQAIQRVNVDFTDSMLNELDEIATEVNVSRQAIIKTFLRQALDEYFNAKKARLG